MNGRSSRSFDRIADRYDDRRGGTERGIVLAADIEPWLAPGTVLEVGVGTGVVSVALRALGRTVFGVDLSGGMLRHARQRLGPTVAQADATAIEERLWSYLWNVEDTTWRSVVVPVVERLRGLPDPDRPRAYRLSPRLVAYQA